MSIKKVIKIKFFMLWLLIIIVGCSKVEQIKTPNKIYSNYKKDKLPELKYPIKEDTPYLINTRDVTFTGNIENLNEKTILQLYKNSLIKGYGDVSPYWRWNVELPVSALENMLNKNLVSLKKQKNNSVYTLVGKKWVLKPLKKNPLGKLKNIKVEKRGPSTIAMDLVIIGSKNTFSVVKEYNIRKVLGFSKSQTKQKKDIILRGKGKIIGKNMSVLPSAFFSIEKKRNSYILYGGGFGHGVGMPQYTAYDLYKKDKLSYKEILKRYYKGIKFEKINSVKGVGKDVLVGITTNSSLEHKKITLISSEKIVLKTGKISKKISKNSRIEISKWKGKIVVKNKGKTILTTKTPVKVLSRGKIGVPSIKRSLKGKKYPTYYGEFNIKFTPRGNLLLVNKVKIEDYLKGVVVSEMPLSFGIEPLKAQAITARTYIANAILGKKYKKYGINVDDTVASQVYNNQNENDISNEAIERTKNIIVTHGDKPITTFYYSTSSGFSSTPKEVW